MGSQELVTEDIKTYLEQRVPTSELAERVSIAAEGNFLWTVWFAEVVTGVGMTCEADIQEELRSYPRDIFGRAFTMLAIAQQPLSQIELLNALAIREGAENYDSQRKPAGKLIEELCSRLVTFDRSCRGCQDNLVLRFPHKTIQDFFLEDPDAMDVPEIARKYFPGELSAHIDFGKTCLTILNYKSYQKCDNILAEIKNYSTSQHASFKYAATFWFQHLMEETASNELFPKPWLSSPVQHSGPP
ncbi:hypothetical protein K490DRAFT_53278 [Saccharata proteae CBS 121410]|uniref:Uncharacterized protein n=1 Tax=Saccharata proteae CBS 121410 TaxID=1314787 RepID=A0A9P4I5E7_9PEZI|nr:hypothetical protein K490DRAFT_53278 [Saccharata proteae CBS 121410]